MSFEPEQKKSPKKEATKNFTTAKINSNLAYSNKKNVQKIPF
jgi:hypothetical protein|tara:strand:- start:247 stop:372 length:126 start_codon:yes stop_codon:yes gene_type:complete